MQMRFVRFQWENIAQTIGTVYARPDHSYYFTPGQYADIGVTTPSGPVARTMTLTTLPSDKLLGFTTRFDRHQSPYKQALLNLKSGDAMSLTDAMGDLVLPLEDTIPLVFVAGGVAIASYISMLRWLTEQQDKRDITLLYAVRSNKDIIYTKEIEEYAQVARLTRLIYTPAVNSETQWHGKIGGSRLTADEIMKFVRTETQIYLSGSESLVEQLRQSLQQDYKIPQYRLAFDFFDGYTEL
jgi:ferredoxin-NADP reductase